VAIPIAAGGELNLENAKRLRQALDRPGALPALIHCASGRRVGVLLAIDPPQ
jgi:hypothetical protein